MMTTILGWLLVAVPAAVQAQFSYSTNADNTLTVISYSGPGGAVAFPKTNAAGLLVTEIGNGESSVFSNLFVTSITVPATITSINYGAFASCYSLLNATLSNGLADIGNFAFFECTSLTNITIPATVTNIGDYAFESCYDLAGVYFTGNAPVIEDPENLVQDSPAAVYYLPNKKGWGQFSTLTNYPVVLWNPSIQASGASFGFASNRFAFNVTGASNLTFLVEACTNLANPVWIPLTNATLGSNAFHFSDAQWTNYPRRFYRLDVP
jgi:hypothetical protein